MMFLAFFFCKSANYLSFEKEHASGGTRIQIDHIIDRLGTLEINQSHRITKAKTYVC